MAAIPTCALDIYGKVGNAGVSICCLDDAKKLYSGFDLCAPQIAVSMTINGPAPVMLGFFLNAAIDQRVKSTSASRDWRRTWRRFSKAKWDDRGLPRPAYHGDLPEGNDGLGLLLLGCSGDEALDAMTYAGLKAEALSSVRGTVQADILKEDQAQNTCIFSTEFALRLMGDVQDNFIRHNVRNFYSVSISGYHIAEAGANPITQLVFTLANGFTYVEYYLSRGMDIDKFGPNLSFFFSNGIDPSMAIGRVARRIWAKAMRERYGASARAQMLKYHIQTSGRSLHAQEIDFNDIRTTLQALYAIYDNCNLLHTNAYDEAITTPTEASVRRAMAIQLIINKELAWPKTKTHCRARSSSNSSPTSLKKRCSASLTASPSGAACSGPWRRCTSARASKRKACTTRCSSTRVNTRSSGSTPSSAKKAHPLWCRAKRFGRHRMKSNSSSPTSVHCIPCQRPRLAKPFSEVQRAAMSGENIFDVLMEACKWCSLGQLDRSHVRSRRCVSPEHVRT